MVCCVMADPSVIKPKLNSNVDEVRDEPNESLQVNVFCFSQVKCYKIEA
jgi:hypothetical protein